ncbi:UNVERIFIED_CONTAM: hypothetical protein NY100_04070 [Prevotella sp. 15_C9]
MEKYIKPETKCMAVLETATLLAGSIDFHPQPGGGPQLSPKQLQLPDNLVEEGTDIDKDAYHPYTLQWE